MKRILLLLLLLACSASAQEIILEGPASPVPTKCSIDVYVRGVTPEEMRRATVMVVPGDGWTLKVQEDIITGEISLRFTPSKANKYKMSVGFNIEHAEWRQSLSDTIRKATIAQPDPAILAVLKKASIDSAAKYPTRMGSYSVQVVNSAPHDPPADPPDEPEPPDVTPFEQTIEKLAKETIAGGGSADTALDISNVFSVVSAAVANGELQVPKPAIDAVNAGMKRVFATHTDEAKWAKFRKDLSDSLDFLRQDGSLQTKAQYVAILQEISNGVRKASQSSK